MNRLACAFALLACNIGLCATPARTLSTSRQFIVFGGDVRLRGSVAQAAERQKSELLALLQIPDHWSVPILLNLGQPQANVPELPAVALNFSQTGGGLKIQLDLLIVREWDPAVLQREVLRALLLELSYRALPSLAAGEVFNVPPDWLVDGILNFNNTAPEFGDALQSAAAHPPALKNFLTLHPSLLDSQSRALYRACAAALLRTLLMPADGCARLVRYISDWPHASADSVAELQHHFPALGQDERSLEASWVASIGRIAQAQRFSLFSFAETSRQLEDCLQQIVAHDSDGKDPLTLERSLAASHPTIDKAATRALVQRLTLLAPQAHPLLRSIIWDYETAAECLARNRTHGMVKRVAAAASLRERVTARMHEVDDYMNWFEATQSQQPSGTFREYLRATETKDAPPRRRDPLSVYLDAMETQVE